MATESTGMVLVALTAVHLATGTAQVRKGPDRTSHTDEWLIQLTIPGYRDRNTAVTLHPRRRRGSRCHPRRSRCARRELQLAPGLAARRPAAHACPVYDEHGIESEDFFAEGEICSVLLNTLAADYPHHPDYRAEWHK